MISLVRSLLMLLVKMENLSDPSMIQSLRSRLAELEREMIWEVSQKESHRPLIFCS